MTRYQREALQREARRDDARAETRMKLGVSAGAYAGRTPTTSGTVYTEDGYVADAPCFRGRGAGGIGRSRRGRSERKRDGGLRFVAYRDAEPMPRVEAKSYGGPIGDKLVTDTQASLVSRPASMPRP
jgi:hypothetical protein